MTFEERDAWYAALHGSQTSTYTDSSGLQVVWRYEDVKQVLFARPEECLSNTNSLDPLDGYLGIMRNPLTYGPFLNHLFPPPARATANASGPLHRKLWQTMAGPRGHFTINPNSMGRRIKAMQSHFYDALEEAGASDQHSGTLNVTELSANFATRVTGEAVGIPRAEWANITHWSEAQSGLLGQHMEGSEQATAVEGLGQLFAASKHIVQHRKKSRTNDFASHLLNAGIPARVAVAAMANSLAAGVHTVAGTDQQGVQRLLSDPERTWWAQLDNLTQAAEIGAKVLQLDPGLVAWKRKARREVELPSGAVLQKGGILALFAAANRDPKVFPNQYDLKAGGKTLTFGIGEHACPGRNIATLSIGVFLHELHKVAPEAELLPPNRPPHARKRDLLFSGADVRIAF